VSITAGLAPAELEKATGLITGNFLKDAKDPKLANDPGMIDYRAFMKQYLPEVDPDRPPTAVFAYGDEHDPGQRAHQVRHDLRARTS